jgi:hypothetical protein
MFFGCCAMVGFNQHPFRDVLLFSDLAGIKQRRYVIHFGSSGMFVERGYASNANKANP